MYPERWLVRPSVLRSLLAGTGVRLCIVKAPPGYGKTVALRQLGEALGDHAAYLSLTERHGDPDVLERALSELFLGDPGDGGGRVVLLDDYDAIAQFPLANELLEHFILALPDEHHIVLATRRRPLLPLGQLRGSRSLVEITEAELAFSRHDLERVFSEVWRLPGSVAAGHVAPLVDGWITGAALLSTSMSVSNSTPRADEIAWSTFDYFAEIVERQTSPATLRFATTCSILGVLRADVCERLTGENQALATLRLLSESSLFTSPTAPGSSQFRFHPLFRAFLRDRLRQELSRSDIEKLHLEAAEALVDCGDSASSLAHFLQARDPARAAALLRDIGIGQLPLEGLSEVEILLNQLSGSTMRDHPWLLALLGRLKRLRNEFDGASASLALAQAGFAASRDDEGLAWVSSELNQVGYRDEAYDGSAITVKNNLDNPSITPLTYANLAAHLCWMQCETGPVPEAMKAGQGALSRGALIDDAFLRNRALMRAHRNLALASVYSGDLDRALALVNHARDTDGADAFELAWADIIYAMILMLRGDLEQTRALLEPLAETAGPYSSTQYRWAQWWLGTLSCVQGDDVGARLAYQEAGTLGKIDEAIMLSSSEEHVHAVSLTIGRGASTNSALRRAGAMLVDALRQAHDDPSASLGLLTAAEESLTASGHILHATSLTAYRAQALEALGRHRESEESRGTAVGFMMHNRVRFLPWGVSMPTPGILAFHSSQSAGSAPFPALIEACPDPGIRERLNLAHLENCLSRELLESLRTRGLTWREIDVLSLYYLRVGATLSEGASLRDRAAKTLGISEHTLKSHITRIRAKLALPESREGTAEQINLLASAPSHSPAVL